MRLLLPCLIAGCSFEHGIPLETGDSGARSDAATRDGDLARDSDSTDTNELTLRPTADTWLREQFPTEIHGSDADLRTGSGSTYNRANRVLLAFDVAAIPTSCTVKTAILCLYFFQEDFTNVSPTLEAHRVTASWTEAATTWLSRDGVNAWGSAGGDFAGGSDAAKTVGANAFGWITWDLTALIGQWRSGSQPNYGVALVEPNDALGNGGRKLFYSMQSATTLQDLRPYLRVTCN